MVSEPISIVERVDALARQIPETIAFVLIAPDGDEVAMTWSELDLRSSQIAGELGRRGLASGDRLGLGLRNSVELVACVFAAWKVGAIPVPVRWDLPDWELTRLREVVEPALYLSDDDLGWIAATADAEVPELTPAISPNMFGICSSGSSGTPKVILNGSSAMYYELAGTPIAEHWRAIPRPQVVMVLAPMYHVNAFATLLSMLSGDQLVIFQKFDAPRIVDVIERHRVTTFTATPTMLQRIADVAGIDQRDLSNLQWILQGAAPMPPSLVERWAGMIGADRVIMAYGQTEALGLTALNGEEWMEHRGSVGRGFNGTELKVLDEQGAELPTGEVGEVYLRSAYAGHEYLGAAKLPRTEEGFQSVGDMGYLDAEGYLYLVDRRADLIITGGANVYPAEVEMALIDHPKIADIVVIGLKDPEWGRRVHAIIEPTDPADPPTFDDVRSYAKDHLMAYKVPKSIEIVDSMPRSAATKVSRVRLVEARGG